MLSGDENKSIGKSGQRKRKAEQEGKKAESRRRKSAQPQEPQPDRLQDAPEAISAPVTPTADSATGTSPADSSTVVPVASVETLPLESAEPLSVASAEPAPVASAEPTPVASEETLPVASLESLPVNYQSIANAYRNYTRQSLEQTRAFFEKLAGVRSLDKAFELQTEFAKQAYEGFVAESRKIGNLQNELARQRLKSWEGFVARMINPR